MKFLYKASLHTCLIIHVLIAGLFISSVANSQVLDSMLVHQPWKAAWITVPGANPTGYGVYYFRKEFDLHVVPQSFPVHVSADNRYKLFVNERLISLGPARGDLSHWNYETVDLAPYLRVGKNLIAAQVWNEAETRSEGHISLRTAFILQGGNWDAQRLNSDQTWKCIQDSSYRSIPVHMQTFYVAGPGEKITIADQPKGWKALSFQDGRWQPALPLFAGQPKEVISQFGMLNGWLLVPSSLPQMELSVQRIPVVRKAEGVVIPKTFPATKTPVRISPNTVATILLDQTFLTNAYPTLFFSGGKGSTLSISYQESLFSSYPEKGDRNMIDRKVLIGRTDSLISDGTDNQTFTSLNYRTYRYVELLIRTKETAFVLEDLYGMATGYPFTFNAKLETNHHELQQMLEIGWRTARLCAMDTYMDCPYYEQLQYIGDSRIQGLVTLYNSGDERLLRNALNLMDYSRQPEGVTASRHPSSTPQYIPTFSLWYIGMLHDYMMYGRDRSFVVDKLPGARQVLTYFKKFQGADGSLKNVPYWSFTDWVYTKGWADGKGALGADGNSALLDLQLLWAYQVAADMEQRVGMKDYAIQYTQQINQLKQTIHRKYWDATRNLYADRAEKDLFSQHANTLAILTGLVPKQHAGAMARQLLSDATLAPASIYFKYYLHQALIKAGLGNDYLTWLGKWRENIATGLTTWAETSELNTTRSDCHAWGASPNIEFFRTILGIDTDAINFSRVKIEPHLGALKAIGGEIPHPRGKVKVSYKVDTRHLQATLELPTKTTGQFIWKGKRYALKEGKNTIIL